MTTLQSADGILIIDKPAGLTSHDVVARVRRVMRTRRVGHTGTLDPFATGVLVVCVNRATRLVQFLMGDDKEYVATMRLGFATDTGDLTGQAIGEIADARALTVEVVEAAMNHFRGRILQRPPMYSAKKVGGKKLYELARRGEEIERAPVEVEIKTLELYAPLTTVEAGSALTRDFTFRVVCTAGTYIRTLAEEIGARLGVGAHLVALRRTRAGDCSLTGALTLDQLQAEVEAGREVLTSLRAAVALPEIEIDEAERKAISQGRSLWRADLETGIFFSGQRAKLCAPDGELAAIAEFDAQNRCWQPRIVFVS